jgi:hypothetical protein
MKCTIFIRFGVACDSVHTMKHVHLNGDRLSNLNYSRTSSFHCGSVYNSVQASPYINLNQTTPNVSVNP